MQLNNQSHSCLLIIGKRLTPIGASLTFLSFERNGR